MSFLTISKKKHKAGEGDSTRFYPVSRYFSRWSLLVLISVLLFMLAGCGIPTFLTLDPPERITSTEVGFSHADANDPNIFLGYEIFYLFYDETSPPVEPSDPDAWEKWAETWLTPAALSNPNSTVMSFENSSVNSDPRFRRAYAGPDPNRLLSVSVTMFPVNPSEVDLLGSNSIQFNLDRQTGEQADTLLFTSSRTGVLAFPDDSEALSYTETALPVQRVIQRDGVTDIVIVDFFDIEIDSDDDLITDPNLLSLSVAFFAVTTGYDFGTRIVSDVVYIGSYDNVLN
jgi:hypothetical protein